MWRQTGYTFYRPGALTIASTIADLPFQTVQMIIFCIIVRPIELKRRHRADVFGCRSTS